MKILNFNTKPKYTHLPQVKNFTWRVKPFYAQKWDFLNNMNEKPNKIKELQTDKNTKERSTKIWQNFSKTILLTNIQNSHIGTTLNIENKSTAYNISKIVTTANKRFMDLQQHN